MASNLIAHVDSDIVSYDALVALPKPEILGSRHYPVPHFALVDEIRRAVTSIGNLKVEREEFAVSKSGAKLFGVMEFVQNAIGSAWRMALGFRNSTDESLSIRGVAGVKVFVCDNMALSGDEFVFSRKNTLGLEDGLAEVVNTGISRYVMKQAAFETEIQTLQTIDITDQKAESLLTRAVIQDVIPARLLVPVSEFYWPENPAEYPDTQARTLWGLSNAFTRALKASPTETRYNRTVALGQFLHTELAA